MPAAPVQAVIDAADNACRERTICMIGPEKGRRLAELVCEKRPLAAVECGTAIGYSGLWIARELQAAANFERAGVASLVEVHTGDAREPARAVEGPVDMLFLDCNFENYPACFEAIRDRLVDGALIVADNVGVGAAAMADYLAEVRTRHESRTEWFDMDLPWGQRDAKEVTVFRKGR